MDFVSYKIYLQNNDSTIKEIRRFQMFKSAYFGFDEFCKKIKELFSELQDGNFIILWKDSEGDEIVISSNEEFKIAFRSMHTEICKLYIKLCSKTQEPSTSQTEKVIHHGICCDNCNGSVVGYRYKCIQCEDYDLCSQCEAKHLHSHHYMIRMPQPLQWYHSQDLIYCLRKFFKKSNVHSNKKHGSHDHSRRKKKCHEFALNSGVLPWLEPFIPYLNNFIETGEEPCPTKSSSKDTPKQKDVKNPKAYVRVYQTDNDDLNVVIDVDTNKPETSSNHNTEKKPEYKEDESTSKNASNPFPGEGRKLFDDEKDEKVSEPDTASVTSQDSITKATAADEWTIVDKHESPEISRASSVLSNLNEVTEKQVPSAPTPAPEKKSSNNKVYPELPKQPKIYHADPVIQTAIESMIKMGFSNKDGLLTYLVEAEYGNINKVLDQLLSSDK